MPIIWNRFFFFLTDSAPIDCNDERDGSNWSSRMSISRVKRELGLLSRDRSAPSGYNGRWAAFGKPVRMPSNRMEHDRITVANVAKCWTKRFHPEWLRSRITEYNRWITPNEGDLTRWDANHVFLLLLFSVSSRFKNKKQKVVIHEFEWRLAAGWRTSKLLYQMLESGEAASAEEITQCFVVEEEPAYGR